jgi:hypothetical protein
MPAPIRYWLTEEEETTVMSFVAAKRATTNGYKERDLLCWGWRAIMTIKGQANERDLYAAAQTVLEMDYAKALRGTAGWSAFNVSVVGECERDYRNAQARKRYAAKRDANAAMWVAIGERDRAIVAAYQANNIGEPGLPIEAEPVVAVAEAADEPTED